MLQRCRTRLPLRKAQEVLGYHPPVSFAESCKRSVAWLAFAGYPVTASRSTRGETPLSEEATPPVSVVITTYNHARYLREAIDSVFDPNGRPEGSDRG